MIKCSQVLLCFQIESKVTWGVGDLSQEKTRLSPSSYAEKEQKYFTKHSTVPFKYILQLFIKISYSSESKCQKNVLPHSAMENIRLIIIIII